MATKRNSRKDSLPDWFDRFPEPRTLPSGWDLSALLTNDSGPQPQPDLAPASRPTESPATRRRVKK